jgi:hypothetical protein
MIMIHELKTLPEYFNAVLSGEKTFEVRKNDRPFHKGDLLALNEYDPEGKCYTGRSCLVYIDYILDNTDYCKSGYVIMAIKPCEVYNKGLYEPIRRGNPYEVPYATKKGETE